MTSLPRSLLALAAALATACAHSPHREADGGADALVGMWRLVNVVAIRADGTAVTSRWGEHPTGFIVYDLSGHIMGDPRSTFRVPDHPTQQEAAAAYGSYLAYAGTFDFDPATSTVTHRARMSLDPTEVGRAMPRKVEFVSGDRIVLTAEPYLLRGEKVYNRLTWERVRHE